MKIISKLFKWTLDAGLIWLFVTIGALYRSSVDMKEFLTTAGVVFGSLIAMCGLVIGYTDIEDDHEKKVRLKTTSTKLLTGTLLFAFAFLFGSVALRSGEIKSHDIPIYVQNSLLIFGGVFFVLALLSIINGLNLLFDILWEQYAD